MSHKPANITGLIGASGSGKSMQARERLRKPFRGLTLVWSTMERTDKWATFLGAQLASSIPAMAAAIKAGSKWLVYVPDQDKPMDRQFDLFCRTLWYCGERGPVRTLIEEVHRVTRASYAPPAWSNLTTGGSHHLGMEIIATTQRPALVDKNFLGNCTELRCYRLVYEDDARAVAAVMREPFATFMDLADLQYVHRFIRERRTVRGAQKIIR